MNSNSKDAIHFCKYVLNLPYIAPDKKKILSGEGGFDSMVSSCESYIWEYGSEPEGCKAYLRYVVSTYQNYDMDANHTVRFSEISSDDLEDRNFDISSDSGCWSTLGSYDDISRREDTDPHSGETFVSFPSGATSFGGLSVLQDEGDLFWSWLSGQDAQDVEILYAWSAIRSYNNVAEMFDTTPAEVKRIYQRAKKVVERIYAA